MRNGKYLLAEGVKGTVKWFNVIKNYGFITREDTEKGINEAQSDLEAARARLDLAEKDNSRYATLFAKEAATASFLVIHSEFVFRQDNPMLSGFRLADGWITASELYSMTCRSNAVALCGYETDARRNIVFAGNVVAIKANAVLKRQPAIQSPLVLQVCEKLRLITAEPAIALIVELLAPGSVGSQNAHGVARVAPVESNVTDSAANLHQMRAGKIWPFETVSFQSLITFTLPRLLVEKIS